MKGVVLIDSSQVVSVCERLYDEYGFNTLGNKRDPTDEYIFLILSTKTNFRAFEEVFVKLKRRFTSWDLLLEVGISDLRDLISPCGLHKQKAKWIFDGISKIRKDLGPNYLEALREKSSAERYEYIISLPGAGVKVSKAIMMYSFDDEVLPVDTHTYRLANRLGWVDETYMRNERGKVHGRLEGIVPSGMRRNFHVNAVMHGRLICHARNPACSKCVLRDLCPRAKKCDS